MTPKAAERIHRMLERVGCMDIRELMTRYQNGAEIARQYGDYPPSPERSQS